MSRSRMSEHVEQYLAFRRAMGFDLRGEGYQLHAFARFADETSRHTGPLTTDLLLYVHSSSTADSSILPAQYCHWGFAGQLIGGSHHTSTQKRKFPNCLPLLASSSPRDRAH